MQNCGAGLETAQEGDVQNEDVGRCSFVLMTDKERLDLSQIFLFRHQHPSSGYNKFNFFVA